MMKRFLQAVNDCEMNRFLHAFNDCEIRDFHMSLMTAS